VACIGSSRYLQESAYLRIGTRVVTREYSPLLYAGAFFMQ